jgi:type I restriction enzyme S subunit
LNKYPYGIIPANLAKVTSDKKKIDLKYLHYWLISPHTVSYLKRSASKTAQPALSLKKIKDIPIPLPSLSIQKKIAAVLDKADRLRQLRKTAIEKLDQLTQSVFLDMFGDPVTNPKGWDVVKVIDVCDCIVPGRDKPKSFTGSIPWITTDDLEPLDITCESKKKMGLTAQEINNVRGKIIPSGSILMTCVGKLGITSIAGKNIVINQQLHSFQCSSNIENEFLQYVLPFKKNYMYKMSTLTTVPYMNKTVCNSIPIILPPINLQKQFKWIVGKIRQKRKKMLIAEDKHIKLLNSLIKQAFNGELFSNSDSIDNNLDWRKEETASR